MHGRKQYGELCTATEPTLDSNTLVTRWRTAGLKRTVTAWSGRGFTHEWAVEDFKRQEVNLVWTRSDEHELRGEMGRNTLGKGRLEGFEGVAEGIDAPSGASEMPRG